MPQTESCYRTDKAWWKNGVNWSQKEGIGANCIIRMQFPTVLLAARTLEGMDAHTLTFIPRTAMGIDIRKKDTGCFLMRAALPHLSFLFSSRLHRLSTSTRASEKNIRLSMNTKQTLIMNPHWNRTERRLLSRRRGRTCSMRSGAAPVNVIIVTSTLRSAGRLIPSTADSKAPARFFRSTSL
jgi:hypothetical protein